jgi:hypothetical protein
MLPFRIGKFYKLASVRPYLGVITARPKLAYRPNLYCSFAFHIPAHNRKSSIGYTPRKGLTKTEQKQGVCNFFLPSLEPLLALVIIWDTR